MGEKRDLDERLLELELTHDLFPGGNRVLHAITRLLVDAKRYSEAERWADRFLTEHPRDPNAHLLKGVVLENTDRCREAIDHFERAFPISGKDLHPALHQHIGSCHYLTMDFESAYEHFESSVNIYLRSEANETLYQYAYAAVIAGDVTRARMLLRALLYATPEKETHLRDRAQGLLTTIDADPSFSSSPLGFGK